VCKRLLRIQTALGERTIITWHESEVHVNGFEKKIGMSHVTGTRQFSESAREAARAQWPPTSVFIHILVNTQYIEYSILTLLELELAWLISYLLLLPFNPPKEPIKMYYVASRMAEVPFLLLSLVCLSAYSKHGS
jgi:hypothetical protein